MIKRIFSVIFLSSVLVQGLASAAANHALLDIRNTAVEHARANFATGDGDTVIEAQRLDPRLKLPVCSQDLHAHLPYGGSPSHSTLVAVSCEGNQPWSLYVPVRIRMYREIAIASRPLARGEILDDTAITMQRREISHLAGGYLTGMDEAAGKMTSRPVQAGQALLSTFLRAPTIVHRGQTITLLARLNNFEVRSNGKALMDGAVGDRIRVRNTRSQRIVEGTIHDKALVYVD